MKEDQSYPIDLLNWFPICVWFVRVIECSWGRDKGDPFIDLPIIYKSNRNYVYFVHYIISTYYIVVKHSNFDTHDPQHNKSTINNQIVTESTQVI